MSGDDSWTPDTWSTGERIAEIESLGVLPAQRGSRHRLGADGRGDAELKSLGVDDVIVGVLPGNAGALELYRRRGFRPTWLYMSRFYELTAREREVLESSRAACRTPR